ncbi:DUF3795 domain-containing protein [Ruminococcus sp.]|uniref:DUF3795 domain-containing protein n=1 Tax=Ruminococcus sp. TaxID=41978 RepID=UPI003446AEA2
MLASCGNDCLVCARYNKPPYEKTNEQLHHTAELWFKIGYRDKVVSNEEISCSSCTTDNWCRYHVLRATIIKESKTVLNVKNYTATICLNASILRSHLRQNAKKFVRIQNINR